MLGPNSEMLCAKQDVVWVLPRLLYEPRVPSVWREHHGAKDSFFNLHRYLSTSFVTPLVFAVLDRRSRYAFRRVSLKGASMSALFQARTL
jgi:hypothetical protein